MEFQAELTLLNPGAIRDIFSAKRKTPPKSRQYDPLALPSDKNQCVHIELEELSEGYSYVRCTKDAVINRHGFLCAEHGADYYTPRRPEYRDKDTEIVNGILAYERRALRDSERVTVRVGAKIKFEYVS